MTENTSTPPPNRLRRAAIFVGIGLLILSLALDVIGLSDRESFGTGQIVLLVMGLFLLLLGWAGSRIGQVYRAAALILLNTIVFLIALELIFAGFNFLTRWLDSRSTGQSGAALPQEIPAAQEYYRDQAWAEQFWDELPRAAGSRYAPFVLWRRKPFSGETINVDANGFRVTPGAECVENAYRIFVFGGSTVFGDGSPDWGTIPAYLQAGYPTERPLCVINMGGSGYTVTQGIIELTMQLQKGHRPDRVIFYDGYNDVYDAYLYQQVNLHHNYDLIQGSLDGATTVESPLSSVLRASNTGRFLLSLLPQNPTDDLLTPDQVTLTDDQAEKLAAEVVSQYFSSYQIVSALGAEIGFEVDFFWQPVIFVTEKPFTELEEGFTQRETPAFRDFFREIYRQIEARTPDFERMHYLGGVLDGREESLYIDTVHLNPEGNAIIAAAILEIFEEESPAP